MKKNTIIIIDDHALIRETWAQLINAHAAYKVVATYRNAEEGIQGAMQLRPAMALLDINLPGMNGLAATKQLRKYVPGIKVIGVSLHTQPAFVKQMMRNGAAGYITKSSNTQEFYTALDTVAQGGKYICSEIRDIMASKLGQKETNNPDATLSTRELEIIDLLKEGYSSKEIASQLNITAKTVEVHRYNILKKLRLKNVAALVHYVNTHPDLLTH